MRVGGCPVASLVEVSSHQQGNDSIQGSAMLTPRPRRIVRREILLVVILRLPGLLTLA